MIARKVSVVVAAICVGLVPATVVHAVAGPADSFFEIDGDYGSTVGDFNTGNGGHPYSAHEIRDGGNETWGMRDTLGCTNWSPYTVSPYMGSSSYTVRCADVPAGQTRRSEQMLLSHFRASTDSERYFTYAFRLRGLPSSLPDGNRGYLAQLHEGGTNAPPFRMQWGASNGRYYLQSGVWSDAKDAQGRLDLRFWGGFAEPQILVNTWYRVLVRVNLGTPPGIPACPYCPGDSGSISVWFMNNPTGAWMELGTYTGRVGYWYQGQEGMPNPPYCSPTECEFQWKVGQYVNTYDHATDYDNVAYGKRWNTITKNRLTGYHKSVVRLPFDEGQGAVVADKSWAFNGGQQDDPVTDYNNDGRINETVRWNPSGAYGKSLKFDGRNYVTVPLDITDFDVGNYVSVSVWFRTTERPTSNKGLVMLGEYSDTWKVLLYGSGEGLGFGVRHPGDTYTKLNHAFPVGRYADGNWHHVVGTFNRFAADGQRMKLYVDGAKVDQMAGLDLPVLRADNRLTVGKFSVDGLFVGDLDEVNVLNYALTDSDVAGLWQRRGQP